MNHKGLLIMGGVFNTLLTIFHIYRGYSIFSFMTCPKDIAC